MNLPGRILLILLLATHAFHHHAFAQEKDLTAGQAAYAEAERARLEKPARRQDAIKKYEEAIGFYRVAGERAGEASALTNIGVINNQLGERQKALEYLGAALSLHKLVGNQHEEVRTLTYMGFAASALTER